MICVPWWQFPVQIPSPWKKTNISLARRPLAGDTSSQPVEEGEEGVEEAVDDGEVGVVQRHGAGRDHEVRHYEDCVEGVEEEGEDPVSSISDDAVLDDIAVNHTPVEKCHEDGNAA